MGKFLNIVVLIIIGVMLANATVNYKGTTAVFNGIGSLWRTSVNGLLGKTTAS